MISLLIVGILCIIVGIYAIVKGDMPLRKKEGIKNKKMYARINGVMGLALGALFISYYYWQFDPMKLFIGLAAIYAGTFVAEMVTKSV